MSVAGRGLSAAFTLCLVTLAACSGDGGARDCTTDEQCAVGARCTGGTCVVNRPPLASVAVPVGAEAFAIVTLDGSGSSDPDAGDAVASHAWRVTPVDAPCAAPIVAGTSATAQARFGCAGRYAVELTVFDALGAASAPATQELEVLPSTAAPIVTALPDVVVGHRCAGDPLVCTLDAPEGSVAIGATAGATAPRLRWLAIPPEGLPLDVSRRVAFEPSADVLAPAVRIETDGTAISGDWIFRLEVHDDLGVLGSADMRVSVTNRPPVIEATRSAVPHRFDAAGSRFTASGYVDVLGYDLDGDPLERQVSSRVVGQGPATFSLIDLGDRLTFSIQVPYGSPEDAAYLIGAPGLERSVTMELRDPNGGTARETWAIDVENQPPHLALATPYVAVDHGFDPAQRRYLATAASSRWVDPDGDPLYAAAPTGDPVCSEVTFRADGTADVTCSAAFTGTPALVGFVGAHWASVLPRDPWTAASAASHTEIRVGNRAPAVVPRAYPATVACSWGSCCSGIPSSCDEYYTLFDGGVLSATDFVVDPDGDPLHVVSDVDSTICEPGACSLAIPFEDGRVCMGSPSASAPFTVNDGSGGLAVALPVGISCAF